MPHYSNREAMLADIRDAMSHLRETCAAAVWSSFVDRVERALMDCANHLIADGDFSGGSADQLLFARIHAPPSACTVSDRTRWLAKLWKSLYHCDNFSGCHWRSLVRETPSEFRSAITHAWWVYVESGWPSAPVLREFLTEEGGLAEAQRFALETPDDEVRCWTRTEVL